MIPDPVLSEALRARHGASARLLSRVPLRGVWGSGPGGSGAGFERVRVQIDGRVVRAVLKCLAPDPVAVPVERRFYEEIAPQVPQMRVPALLASGAAPEAPLGWLLLEDFGRVKQRASWTPDDALRAIAQIARLHAAFLGRPPADLQRPHTRDLHAFLRHVPEGVARLREAQARWLVLRPLGSARACEIALALARTPERLQAALAASPESVIHRDFHPGNVAVPRQRGARRAERGGDPIVFDWEDVGAGPPIFDVTLFFSTLGLSWREWPRLGIEWSRYGAPLVPWDTLLDAYLGALGPGVDEGTRAAIVAAAPAAFVWEALYRIGWVHHTFGAIEPWLERWSRGSAPARRLAAWRADESGLRCRADVIRALERHGETFL